MPEPASIALLGTGFVGLTFRFLRKEYRRAKPVVEWVAALLLLVLLAPVMGVCALLVKLTSRGPVIYRQERVGRHGRTFTLLKLRTMRVDAEAETGPVWAKGERDPRVTPVGHLLRSTHLDELPQLINVLRGEMSLVGPRPERPHFVEQLRQVIPDYEQRLEVKPGITGLAQVRLPYDRTLRDVRRKVKLDCLYIRRMCWWVDAVILFGTLGKVFGLQMKGGIEETEDLTQGSESVSDAV